MLTNATPRSGIWPPNPVDNYRKGYYVAAEAYERKTLQFSPRDVRAPTSDCRLVAQTLLLVRVGRSQSCTSRQAKRNRLGYRELACGA